MKRSLSPQQLHSINSYLEEEINSLHNHSNNSRRSIHSRQSGQSRGAGSRQGGQIEQKIDDIHRMIEHTQSTPLQSIMDKINKLEEGLQQVQTKQQKRKRVEKSTSRSRGRTDRTNTDDGGYKLTDRGLHILETPSLVTTRKELEEQIKKTLLQKDRVRELKALNLELKGKIRKLAAKLSGFDQLQSDYQLLLKNYEQSEKIRLEQEKMIVLLKKQLRRIEK